MSVWAADALSGLSLDLHGRAIWWRVKRQASARSRLLAFVDGVVLVLVVALVAWGVL